MIEMKGLNHHYVGGELKRQVLFDIEATVNSEVVMMKGPSGSGKSTLLTLIGALRSVQQGSLRVLGSELHGATPEALVAVRRRIGFIFQHHNLLDSLTAEQNVELALSLADEPKTGNLRARAREMLDQVGLGPCGMRYPHQMSGGQRQRVAIARALAPDPRLILADEPTASLDGRSGIDAVAMIVRMVRERGCTALIVTHDDRILHFADRLLQIEDGRLVEVSSSGRRLAA